MVAFLICGGGGYDAVVWSVVLLRRWRGFHSRYKLPLGGLEELVNGGYVFHLRQVDIFPLEGAKKLLSDLAFER